ERGGGFLNIVVRSATSADEHEIRTVFTFAAGLTWFPDNKSVVFYGRRGNEQPMLHRIDLQTHEDLLHRTILGGGPGQALSADGGKLYYGESGANGEMMLMGVDLDSGRKTQIFRQPGSSPLDAFDQILVAVNGPIAFRSLSFGGSTIRVVAASGGDP